MARSPAPLAGRHGHQPQRSVCGRAPDIASSGACANRCCVWQLLRGGPTCGGGNTGCGVCVSGYGAGAADLAGARDTHAVCGVIECAAGASDDGLARGVSGSPHFWLGDHNFFCPALDLGHDADNHLTARFDPEGLAQFFALIDA